MATARVVPLLPNNGVAAEAPLTASLGGGLVTIGLEADAAAKAAFDKDATYPPDSIGDSLQQVIPGSALELRSDLSSTSDPEKGAGAVGFSSEAEYPSGSVGSELQIAQALSGVQPIQTVFNPDGSIVETYVDFVVTTTFPAGGVTRVFSGSVTATIDTTFNPDGSISEAYS